MPQLRKVFPGDLITAEGMNAVIDEINAIKIRLNELGTAATSVTTITSLVPPSGTIQLGRPLEVIGSHFRVTSSAMRTFIDDTAVVSFLEANDERLVFIVPTSLIVPQSGRAAMLTVSNGFTTAQRAITLQPLLTIAGSVDVTMIGSEPATPAAGSPFTIEYRLRSRATVEAAFTIDAQFALTSSGTGTSTEVNNAAESLTLRTILPGGGGFPPITPRPAIQILDRQRNVVESGAITVAPGQEEVFFVRIPIPSGTDSAPFTVTVTVTAGGVTGSAGVQPFTVGKAAEKVDESFSLDFEKGVVAPGAAGEITPALIRLPVNGDSVVTLTAVFTVATSYAITAAITQGTKWSVKPNPPTGASITIGDDELKNTQKAARKPLNFVVHAADGASATGQVEFKVTRAGQTVFRTHRMTLQLM
jgi:hypothetical protein